MATFTYSSIDVPKPLDPYVYISVTGVDAAGEAVGTYGDVDLDYHGFVVQGASGTPFDPPGASTTGFVGITASGEIFGDYVDEFNKQHGFVDNNGVVTQINAILASSTTVIGVTGTGEAYGGYTDIFGDSQGFVENNGVYTAINVPGAVSTTVYGVSATGLIAGVIIDKADQLHGFIDNNGAIATFDPAGSTATYVVGVNASNEVVGNYIDAAGNQHGYVYANGTITPINVPGAGTTGISGINDAGEIVGYYSDSLGNIHGFTDDNGLLASIEVPGATQTDILGINDAGDIYGYYNDSAGEQHGFVGSVAPPTVAVVDTTTGQSVSAAASAYSGPVGGLQEQYIYGGTDNVNISVNSDNWFLHGGPGNDAIVAIGGTNVLDGGTGSNFLSGGSGSDTFFVDDRSPATDIWSTVNGFHAGDAATVFGVTPGAFNLAWVDGQGATGYQGLTLHASAANVPTASLTLSGYTTADLTNGQLSIDFGSEADGTPYMYVFGVSNPSGGPGAGGEANAAAANVLASNQLVSLDAGSTVNVFGGNDTVVAFGGDTINLLGAGTTIAEGAFSGGQQSALPDTVVGFAEGSDRLTFAGESSGTETAVVGSAQIIGGNTVLSFPDHGSIILAGVTHIDSTIFG